MWTKNISVYREYYQDIFEGECREYVYDVHTYQYNHTNWSDETWVKKIKEYFIKDLEYWRTHLDNPETFYKNYDIRECYKSEYLEFYNHRIADKNFYLREILRDYELHDLAVKHISAEELPDPEEDDFEYSLIINEWLHDNEDIILDETGYTDDYNNYQQNVKQIEKAIDTIPYAWFVDQFAKFFNIKD